ncbi:hypothetical protein EVAR_20856_1 [Eumeta japonica]|uniref:Uncharacterized protein n=1 Tax=Eumeta variegata TaxID=151549 RepID=A0A4C1UDK3_EUMVA|nr:hypothetical protein EVAR_20856_1 [Eumeta japonica]
MYTRRAASPRFSLVRDLSTEFFSPFVRKFSRVYAKAIIYYTIDDLRLRSAGLPNTLTVVYETVFPTSRCLTTLQFAFVHFIWFGVGKAPSDDILVRRSRQRRVWQLHVANKTVNDLLRPLGVQGKSSKGVKGYYVINQTQRKFFRAIRSREKYSARASSGRRAAARAPADLSKRRNPHPIG